MRQMSRFGSASFFVAIFFVTSLAAQAQNQNLVVGVNVVNPLRASVADQNTVLDQLKAAEVHVIRCGISNDDKGVDFAKRAAARGIRIQLIVGAQYPPNAPSRPYQPDIYPAMWGGPPLSLADPALSKAAFQKLFDSLDANNLSLAGVELGNEINWRRSIPSFHSQAKEKSSVFRILTMIPRESRSQRVFSNTSGFSPRLKMSATTLA